MSRSRLFFIAIVSAGLWSSCATPGAPMPPSLQLPRPVEDLNYARKGQRVVLAWTPPSQTTEHLGLRHTGVTYICRSIGRYPVDSCTMIKRLSASEVETVTDKKREQAIFEDVIPADALGPAAFATYSIQVFNTRGRTAGLSNQVRVALAPTLPPPQDLQANVTSQGPVITFTAASGAAANGVDYSFRVMRRLEGVPNFSMLEDLHASGRTTFTDHAFEWQKNYDYKIVPVTSIGGATVTIVEGDDSPVVHVSVQDVFPPAQPSGVQAVFSSVGQKPFIDLSWTPNSESDLAGYNVFRRDGDAAATKITAQPVQAPSFRDNDVRPGARYTYSVVAVDLRGNQSPASPEASESVPVDAR